MSARHLLLNRFAAQFCRMNAHQPLPATQRGTASRAGRRTLASVPTDQLEQAQAAIEALGSMQQPQQFETGAAATEQDITAVMHKTRSSRKHKRNLPLDEQKQEEIRQKIAASLARKAAKVRYTCPACAVTLTRVDGVVTHMLRCCVDLLDAEVQQQGASIMDAQQLQQILTAAATREQHKCRQALEITFLQPQTAAAAAGVDGSTASPHAIADRSSSSSDDEDGDPDNDVTAAAAAGGEEQLYESGYSKQTRQRIQEAPAEIAAQLGVTRARAERLLRQAMRSVPIAIDSSTPLDVVFEDADFIAVNKPVGFHTAPVHRWQEGSVVSMLLAHLARCSQQQEQQKQQQHEPETAKSQPHAKPYVLHRLDVNTSGLLLFGKRREVVPVVSAQFRERRVHKEYLAITVGVPSSTTFTVDAPIGHHPSHDTARCITDTGKPAVTHFEVVSANPTYDLRAGSSSASIASGRSTTGIASGSSNAGAAQFQEGELFHERGGGAAAAAAADGAAAGDTGVQCHSSSELRGVALVRCYPKSGRTHQIRLHLAHLGHPLVGDEVYGVTGGWIGRQALHARALALRHPLSGKQMRFVAPLHEDFMAALEVLGLALPADDATDGL